MLCIIINIGINISLILVNIYIELGVKSYGIARSCFGQNKLSFFNNFLLYVNQKSNPGYNHAIY